MPTSSGVEAVAAQRTDKFLNFWKTSLSALCFETSNKERDLFSLVLPFYHGSLISLTQPNTWTEDLLDFHPFKDASSRHQLLMMTFSKTRNWIKENKYSEAVAHYVTLKWISLKCQLLMFRIPVMKNILKSRAVGSGKKKILNFHKVIFQTICLGNMFALIGVDFSLIVIVIIT